MTKERRISRRLFLKVLMYIFDSLRRIFLRAIKAKLIQCKIAGGLKLEEIGSKWDDLFKGHDTIELFKMIILLFQ